MAERDESERAGTTFEQAAHRAIGLRIDIRDLQASYRFVFGELPRPPREHPKIRAARAGEVARRNQDLCTQIEVAARR